MEPRNKEYLKIHVTEFVKRNIIVSSLRGSYVWILVQSTRIPEIWLMNQDCYLGKW